MSDSTHQLYGDLAPWWPLMSAPSEYEEEAAIYSALLEEACDGPIGELLELGSGGGNNAVHMKQRFEHLVLTDLSDGMLDVSRRLNPECEHFQADMRELRLERSFDAVFVHDAVCYMTTLDDLRRAVETAWRHCRPGGAALFAPDYLKETFPGTCNDEGGHDEVVAEDGLAEGQVCTRGLRYLSWSWDPDPNDDQYLTDYAYLVRERDGSVTAVHDRHAEGLFSRAEWLEVLEGVGFNARAVPLEHSEVEPGVHEMFVVHRPA